ncbi:MAG: ribonuclease HII [Parcubacteria group bacterium]|nr:ribonuclease HII [Parcubacteria group bacterium]MBI3074592.1 ribonuclease HII [Parcubacteria group bacterium]
MRKTRVYSKLPFRCLIGVDEAGRGPLAGPLAVCALMMRDKKSLRFFAGIKDSKQLSEKKREVWFEKIRSAAERGVLSYEVALVSNKEIDKKGMSFCLKDGVRYALSVFALDAKDTLVLLDGTLHAPKDFPHQVTVIKGDERERIIAMASIMAKVARDRYMTELSKKYPAYGFEIHKGYGTKKHYAALARYGASAAHRRTFIG